MTTSPITPSGHTVDPAKTRTECFNQLVDALLQWRNYGDAHWEWSDADYAQSIARTVNGLWFMDACRDGCQKGSDPDLAARQYAPNYWRLREGRAICSYECEAGHIWNTTHGDVAVQVNKNRLVVRNQTGPYENA
jgi:hypothetical protein